MDKNDIILYNVMIIFYYSNWFLAPMSNINFLRQVENIRFEEPEKITVPIS